MTAFRNFFGKYGFLFYVPGYYLLGTVMALCFPFLDGVRLTLLLDCAFIAVCASRLLSRRYKRAGRLEPVCRPMINTMRISSDFVMTVAAWLFGNILVKRMLEHVSDPALDGQVSAAQANLVLYFAISVLLAPLCEELLYRGILLDGFLRITGNAYAAIGLSSLIFGLAHGTLSHNYFGTLLGCMFGVIYVAHGSLAMSVFAHFICNFLAVLLYDLSGFGFLYSWPTAIFMNAVAWSYILLRAGECDKKFKKAGNVTHV